MSEATHVVGKTVGAGRRYYHPLQKDYATLLETSEETGGDRTLIEIEVAPGGGNAPHFHKTYEEHFEVIEGCLEVLVGGETRILRPGHTGFEKAIKAGYGLAADGLTGPNGAPKNIYHLAVLLGWSEIRMPGVFTLAEPLFRLLARRARRKGIEAELEAGYCR
jgi:quercetin dioxygenase-like cupin family protein